jgi:hypothetical protein
LVFIITAEVTVNPVGKGGRDIFRPEDKSPIHAFQILLEDGNYYDIAVILPDNRSLPSNKTYNINFMLLSPEIINKLIKIDTPIKVKEGILWDKENHWATGKIIDIEEKP